MIFNSKTNIIIINIHFIFYNIINLYCSIKMELLGKNRLRENVKYVVLLKYFTYIFLIWNLNCDQSTFGKSLEMKYEQVRSLNISFNRLLAKHELKKDSYKTYSSQKYANYGTNKNIKSEEVKIPIQSQIRKDCLNNYDVYMKDYKNRYGKKKGLAKWDCYCERKLFNKINNIIHISENMKNDEKLYKKKKYNKYVIYLILFGLFPFLGSIMPLLFGEHGLLAKKMCFSTCKFDHVKGSGTVEENRAEQVHKAKNIYLSSIDKDTFEKIGIVNDVFLWLSFSIVLLILLYVLIKIIKYARIKSGKGKMSVKDYCHFCKDLITAKR
ncbi:hypothetical protein PVMG_06135 [Plasmodium vivax Mauritania I]|uniref:Variable surface protein Vir35 n=1 Tax=Plasmodium vivax Mauritania I TaxID=1035515 RepID=A0A0J9T4R7_PLAVI|nr:hypothetical protein PVMG_06135 [Plasmodium vivax Mauritania I]